MFDEKNAFYENCAQILLVGYFVPKEEQWEVVDEIFFTKIMKRKFEVFKIDVEIDPAVYMILSFTGNGHLGLMQLWLKKIMENANTRHITIEDYSRTFENFPYLEDPEERKRWEDEYDRDVKRSSFNPMGKKSPTS